MRRVPDGAAAPRIAAISRLVLPAATHSSTSRSRAVRRGVHRGIAPTSRYRFTRCGRDWRLELGSPNALEARLKHEADEEPPVDVDRSAIAWRMPIGGSSRCRRGFQERLARDEVADPLGHRGRVAGMGADQRMRGEIAVEHFDLARRNRARGVAHYAAVVAVEVAHRERGELGTDRCGERGDARRAKPPGASHSAPMAWSASSAACRSRLVSADIVSNLLLPTSKSLVN